MVKKSASNDLEAAAKKMKSSRYVLKLYVAGVHRRSSAAIRNITAICDEQLKGRYSLQIIDIYKNPTLAKGEQIIAVPTLIKELPNPIRRLIGDISDKEKVILGLDLKKIDEKTKPAAKVDKH